MKASDRGIRIYGIYLNHSIFPFFVLLSVKKLGHAMSAIVLMLQLILLPRLCRMCGGGRASLPVPAAPGPPSAGSMHLPQSFSAPCLGAHAPRIVLLTVPVNFWARLLSDHRSFHSSESLGMEHVLCHLLVAH